MRGKILPMILATLITGTGCATAQLQIPAPETVHTAAWPQHHVVVIFTADGLGRVTIYYGSSETARLVKNVKLPWTGTEAFNSNYADWFLHAWVRKGSTHKGYAHVMIWIYDIIKYESGKVKRHNIGVVGSDHSHHFASANWQAY